MKWPGNITVKLVTEVIQEFGELLWILDELKLSPVLRHASRSESRGQLQHLHLPYDDFHLFYCEFYCRLSHQSFAGTSVGHIFVSIIIISMYLRTNVLAE